MNNINSLEELRHTTKVYRGETKYDAIVLDAQLRQSLVTIRSLGRRGRRVAAVEISSMTENAPYVPAFSSRWCQRAYIAPTYEHNATPFRQYLKQLLDRNPTQVLISSSDGTLDVMREQRKELEQRVRLALAREEALRVVVNKAHTLEIAEQLGIGIPRSVQLGAANEVAEAIKIIGLPAVVKPVESWLWRNGNGEKQQKENGIRLICQLATTRDEACRAVEELTSTGSAVLFQQFLEGRREAISFLYARGEMYAKFAQWAKRTQPPLGGMSVYRQSIALPYDSGAQAERLVREIDLEGYSEVEFRRDRDGKPYLMEINPRLSASVEIAVRAGIDFPYMLYQWANEEKIDRVKGYKVGGWMRFLSGDLLTTVQSIKQQGRPGVIPPAQAIGEFLTAFAIPASYDYFDMNDLVPAYKATLNFAHSMFQKITGKT